MFTENRASTLAIAFALSLNVLSAQPQNTPGESGGTGDIKSGYSIFHGTVVDMTWPELKKAAEENAIVILPVGVIEQHGPHLCLGTDTYGGYRMSLTLRQQLESIGVKAIIAPPLYWGIMQLNESGAFPGSFTVTPSTMKALLADIFADLHRWGFRNFFCTNHHGDRLHVKTLNEAIAEAKEKLGIRFYNDMEMEDEKNEPPFSIANSTQLFQPDYHSGAFETSLMAEWYPEFVNVEKAKTLKPQNTWQPLGYVGDPANFKNVKIMEHLGEETNYKASCIAKWMKTTK